jgi:uncharacterized membrane protein YphA (DoxX/SURF4 family)
MQPDGQATIISPTARWTGRILSGLVVLFLLFDGTAKLVPLSVVIETMERLGYPPNVDQARILGVLTIACAVLYAIPRTSILGAILLTGYLGGAIATHFRLANPLFSHQLFGLYIGLMAWGGLYLRDAGLRALIPIRRRGTLST